MRRTAAASAAATARGPALADRGAAVEGEQGKQRRAVDLDLCVGLLDLRDRDRDVEIVLLRLLDQREELARVEAAPPVELRHGGVGGAVRGLVFSGRVEGEIRLDRLKHAAGQMQHAENSNVRGEPARPCRIAAILMHQTHEAPPKCPARAAIKCSRPGPKATLRLISPAGNGKSAYLHTAVRS